MAMHNSASSLTVVAAISLLVGCNKDLTEKPVRTAAHASFETKNSTIGASVEMPMAELQQMLNQSVPQSFGTSGAGPDLCQEIKVEFLGVEISKNNVCAGTSYAFNADRDGPITVSAGETGTIRLQVPISFSGKGGFDGDLAKLISLHEKNFKGSLALRADLKPTLGADWCPKLEGAVSYTWISNPKIEIVGGAWVDIKGQVEDKLGDQLPKMMTTARDAIDCTRFRAELDKVYAVHSFPIDVPNIGKIYINVTPTDFGFSGVHVVNESISMAMTLSANVEASNEAAASTPLPLPTPKTIPMATPRMLVTLPVRTSYETLSIAISKVLSGQSFETDTPAGKVVVKISGVEFYPSNGQLVAGLSIAADLPTSIFDTTGTVYVLGTPIVEGGTKISLKNPAYSTSLDNGLWTAAASILEGQILQKMREAGIYDLTNDIAKAEEALTKRLGDPKAIPGVIANASDITMKIGQVAVAEKTLDVEGIFGAGINLALKQ